MQYQHNAADITVESVWLYCSMREREKEREREREREQRRARERKRKRRRKDTACTLE